MPRALEAFPIYPDFYGYYFLYFPRGLRITSIQIKPILPLNTHFLVQVGLFIA